MSDIPQPFPKTKPVCRLQKNLDGIIQRSDAMDFQRLEQFTYFVSTNQVKNMPVIFCDQVNISFFPED
jgi:hypothetical protein